MSGTKRVIVGAGVAALITVVASVGFVVEAARAVPRVVVTGRAGIVDRATPNSVTTLNGELLEKIPTGRTFDQLIATLPQNREVTPAKLPDGWTAQVRGNEVRLSGPPIDAIRFRLDINGNWVKDYLGKDITFQSSYKGAKDEPLKLKLDMWPTVETTPNLEGILTVPPQAAPGMPLLIGVAPGYRDGSWQLSTGSGGSVPLIPLESLRDIKVVKSDTSALYGWSKTDGYTRMMSRPAPRPFVTEFPTMGGFTRARYTDPWGDMPVDAPVSITPATPSASGRALTGGSQLNFAGQAACLSGRFPTFDDAYGLLLDHNIKLDAWGASPTNVMVGIPEKTTPGAHTISDGTSKIGITVLTIEGSLDQTKLWRGESTTMRLRVLGTDRPFPLAVLNRSPGVITIDGGVRQVVTTPGGADNAVTRSVTGIQRGNFTIVYSVNAPGCGG